MATKTVFISSQKSGVKHEMQCFLNDKHEIFISIFDSENIYDVKFICLDKNTAIKFVKHLKKEISILNESEVNNEESN